MKKHVAALILAMLMAASVLGGCSSGKTAPAKYASTAVADFNGETIYMDELNYYVRKTQYENEQLGYLEYMGVEKWDDEVNFYNITTYIPGESLVESAMTSLRQTYVLAAEAEKEGISLTEDEQAKAAAAAEKYLSETDEALLDSINLTADRLTEIYTRNALANKMYQEFTAGVDTTVSDDDARQYDVSYLLLTQKIVDGLNLGEGVTPEKFAGQLVDQVNGGVSLSDAAKDYEGLSVQKITMGDSDTDTAYGKLAVDLKVGRAGSVSNGSDGDYYVVTRDSDFNEQATEKKKAEIAQEKIDDAFSAAYAEWESAYSFKPDYKKIKSLVVSERIYEEPETTGSESAAAETSSSK